MGYYIVKTSCAAQRGSWKWRHRRRNVAVLEVEPGVSRVAMISERARGVRRIVAFWGCLYEGSSERCQYAHALAAAEALAAKLNAGLNAGRVA